MVTVMKITQEFEVSQDIYFSLFSLHIFGSVSIINSR